MRKIVLRKEFLIFLGLLFTFILLETSLRFGGFLFFQIQKFRNFQSINHQGTYPILCVGESTTGLGGDIAYPRQLEEVLNQRQNKIRFSVINVGMPSATTTELLKHLDDNLERYHPHIVITMLGINDTKATLPYQGSNANTPAFLSQWRTVKLLKFLQQHLNYKFKEMQSAKQKKAALVKAKKEAQRQPSFERLLAVANLYADLNQPAERKEILLQMLALEPRNPSVYAQLAVFYSDAQDYSRVGFYIARMLNFLPSDSPQIIRSLFWLARAFELQKKYGDAEQIYYHLDTLARYDAVHFAIYTELVNLAIAQKQLDKARELFFKQLSFSKEEQGPYRQVAHVYRKNKKYAELEDFLRNVLATITPQTRYSLSIAEELGLTLLDQGKNREAENVFESVRKTSVPGVEDIIDLATQGLVTALKAQGRTEEALAIKVKELPASSYYPATIQNYKKFKTTILDRAMILLCVQYPMRPLEPLKNLIGREDKVFYVDNEKNFQEAVATASYDDYFTDRFAGDFGHFTKKGSHLLAQNIADVILEDVFQNKLQD